MSRYKRNMGFWIRKQKKLHNISAREAMVKFNSLRWFDRTVIQCGINRAKSIRWMNREDIRDSKINDDIGLEGYYE